jgi:hypothetical protein
VPKNVQKHFPEIATQGQPVPKLFSAYGCREQRQKTADAPHQMRQSQEEAAPFFLLISLGPPHKTGFLSHKWLCPMQTAEQYEMEV